jgi:nucleoid-associated protein YgaU
MNATHTHNRFAKKVERPVRFGITRGQAILFLLTFSLFFYLLTELVFASVAEGSTLKEGSADYTAEAAFSLQEVTVREGDSLWKLSLLYQEEAKMDVRRLVEEIKAINDLDDVMIYPGQTLLIPKQ